jgi:peptidoglycan/LPS O-acetylase OafA/YrhL
VLAAVLSAARPANILQGVPYLLFLNAFERFAVPLGSFSGVWWTLATEVQFYLILPLIAVLLRPQLRRIGICVLAVYAVAYTTFVFDGLRPRTFPQQVLLAHSLFGEAPLFLFGAVAAWMHTRVGDRMRRVLDARSVGRYTADVALGLILLALGLLLRWTVQLGPIYELPPYGAWHIPEGVLWTAVLLLLLDAPLRSKPLLSNRLLAGCGVISYSMYLVHVPLIAGMLAVLRSTRLGALSGWGWDTALVVVAMTAACFAVSTATYWLVERPFLVRKARLA